MMFLSLLLGAASVTSALAPRYTNGTRQPVLRTVGQGAQTLQILGNPNDPPQMPTNGVVRSYYWDIARGVLAPDGVPKHGIYVNNQFPGPVIEANYGDTFQITVRNSLQDPEEGTSIHWHGMLQYETPWFDGVPSASQCPIAPGKEFTYSFVADQCGSSWWHAHYSAQYNDGLAGPMIVHCNSTVAYDIDVGPVTLSDYYYTGYYQLLKETIGKRETPFSDNNLINGKNNANCSIAEAQNLPCIPNAGVAKFRFQSGKTHLLRLINPGAEGLQRFTIDDHQIWIISNDFISVEPYMVDEVILGVGQRSDIIVVGTGNPNGAYWMRSTISEHCSFASQPYALAAIYYEDANTFQDPTTTGTPPNDTNCHNDPLTETVPFYPTTPPQQPSIVTTIHMTFGPNATGDQVWMMNGQSFRGDYNDPILLLADQGNISYPDSPEWNVYDYRGDEIQSIRLILTSDTPLPHPMHLHGHNYWVLAEGVGEWDGTVTRPENPQRRDTQLLWKATPEDGPAGNTYLVLEWLAQNPGVWPMHCHNAWHLSSGMYVNILERPDLIPQNRVPDSVFQTCRDWDAWTNRDVPDQIDSGV